MKTENIQLVLTKVNFALAPNQTMINEAIDEFEIIKARVEEFTAWIDDMISRYNPGWHSTVLMQEIRAMQQKMRDQ